MSVWTNIKGTVDIRKTEKVSIKKLIDDVFTDEFSFDIQTEDKGDFFRHTIECNMSVDGYHFIRNHEKFLDGLKAVRKDLVCKIRLL